MCYLFNPSKNSKQTQLVAAGHLGAFSCGNNRSVPEELTERKHRTEESYSYCVTAGLENKQLFADKIKLKSDLSLLRSHSFLLLPSDQKGSDQVTVYYETLHELRLMNRNRKVVIAADGGW